MSETQHTQHTQHHEPTQGFNGNNSAQNNFGQGGGLLDAPPKTTFVMGLLTGIVATIIVGYFFVMPNLDGKNKVADSNTTTNTNINPSAGQPTGNDEPAIGNFKAVSDDDHIRGNKKATLTILEYSDMQCPFCKRFHPTMLKIMDDYKDKIRWAYRHFPLSSIHPFAQKAAEGAECAVKLKNADAFWTFMDAVMATDEDPTADNLVKYAKGIDIDETKFKTCLDSGEFKAKVQEQYSDATTAGGQGTPYSILIDKNGNKSAINGAQPYESVKAIIDAAL